jgi:hypothetical protein
MEKSLSSVVAVLLLVTVSLTAQSEPVSFAQAQRVARQFVLSGKGKFVSPSGNALVLAHEAKSVEGITDYYVFNHGDDGGFVVVSGDDRVAPIAGYCEKGSFDVDDLPENVEWWFREYQRQMQFLRDNPKVKARKKVTLNRAIAPLLTTHWSQCRPYNDMCPVAPAYDDPFLFYGGRACTGCVATATAQVMKYWEWPKRGTGTHSYSCDVSFFNAEKGAFDIRTDDLSVDFEQSAYDWELMRDEYLYGFDDNNELFVYVIDDNGRYVPDYDGTYGNAVAKLMSDVGIAVDMGYGSSGSGADSYNVYKVLYYNFGYLVRYASRDESGEGWDEFLRAELDAGHPLYYSGSGSEGGHAFVLDGYDQEGLFHVNWGWGGSCDGYYESLSLDPDRYHFDSHQQVITCEPYKPFTSIPENGKTIDFGIVPMDSAVFKTIMVYGQRLDSKVVVNITGKDAFNFQTEVFTIQPSELNEKDGYALEIVYFPAVEGSHTAQLTLTPQGNDLHGNPLEPICFTLRGRLGDVCDVNLDGEVNIADVNTLAGLILSSVSDSIVGDVNLDGEISIADMNALIDTILGM